MTPAQRYREAYYLYMERTATEFFAASGGRNMRVDIPRTTTANGLTLFITKYITYLGFRATRINVSGRLVDTVTTTEHGNKFRDKKYIKSSTRKGTADISATINGRSVMIEVKIGSDRPSPAQLQEQQRERAAGGVYEFIRTPEEAIALIDSILYG